ncbi:argininosuccinate lyase [Legionella sp. EUR-108]|uniref:Argininosuccinate lyase n=1 Tax=Legionella maioricensis TaxID=2896528 RepID=A0A9X2D1R6_9GAMM|nr:argininosuccinate lyase [Legionella maioricensis]MCL9684495.1 argininosuccinate lyase [Legionella maioricensis]MCL9687911.1 argininosuccinate lyase [Legionella maioricensis]
MSNKTWGGRFKKPLDPLTIQFNASLAFDHVLYAYDIQGSQVHATMLARQGIISAEEAQEINAALAEIKLELQKGQHALDEAYEDIHMFIEHLLIEKIGETGKKLHTGRSRNDQVALDLRLYTRDAASNIMAQLYAVTDVLRKLSYRHAQDKMPGYTHLQQAQPIYLGWVFDAYLAMFNRDITRLQDLKKRMNFSPLGAGALAGSSLPLDREWVAQTLGFDGVINNTLDAVSDRDFIMEFCGATSVIMVHLSRLCEDLILWATQEFGFITLDDGFATGSSLMPNKKNPDILELIRGKSGRVFGHLLGILTVMKGLPLAYNKDMQEDKEGLFDSVKTVTSCLTILAPFLESLHFNTELMEKKANSGYLDATATLETLILKGVPFRDAHHQVGQMVAAALDKGCSLSEIINESEFLLPDTALTNSCPNDIQHPPKSAEQHPIKDASTIKHLLTGKELESHDLLRLLKLASQIKQNPEAYRQALAGKNLAMIFEKPSFRTRLSFTLAMENLGGTAIESVSTTRKQEEPRDLIRVLNGYCDYVMLRTHDDNALLEMAQFAKVPIINGLSALYHPCQALADLLSLQEQFGKLNGLTLAYVGDGNNVLHSLLLMAPLVGVKINFCCPADHQPNNEILTQSKLLFDAMILAYPTPEAAVQNADAIYTDVWTSMGFEPQDAEHHFAGFQVNESLMEQAKPGAVFMHCMPMERGKEVSVSLPDSAASIIFSQSENRMHVQKALLIDLGL